MKNKNNMCKKFRIKYHLKKFERINVIMKNFTLLLFLTYPVFAQELHLDMLNQNRHEPIEVTYKIVKTDTLNLVFRYPPNFEEAKNYPAIIFFFGGGWINGNVSHFKPQSEYFASRGMISVCADYRTESRHGTTPFEAVSDAKSAIRFLRKHAGELNIDVVKIVGSGGSAGGHLAAAASLLPGLDDPMDDLSVSSKANALVLFNPVFDNGPKGYGYERIGERYLEISPFHNIRKGAPPTIVFFGTKDKLIPVTTAKEYKKRMESVGSRCDLHLYEGQKHGFFNRSDESDEYFIITVREADLFLISLKYLSGKPIL